MPFGQEFRLLQSQFEHSAGIFQCNEYTVFSNATIDVAFGLTTYAVPGPILVQTGGKRNLALNTNVFIRMWKAVQSIGKYKKHAWSIKLDPDCVFFPERFRDLISRKTVNEPPVGPLIPSGSVFLENCEYGMIGPIEALSRDAMQTFLENMDSCEDIRQAAMDIFPTGMPASFDDDDHGFGEDQYLRGCLLKLGVTKVDEFESLLSDKSACVERPTDCGGAQVAFHSFNSVPEWLGCWQFAPQFGHWPSEPTTTTVVQVQQGALPPPQVGLGQTMAPTFRQPAVASPGGGGFLDKLKALFR